MRSDGTLDDPFGPGRPADRSDDTPSTNRSTRLQGLFRRTRFWAPMNPRPGRTRLAAQVTLREAVTESCNTGFAQLGVRLGADKVKEK
ncbi:hypothetical protein ACWEOR_20230, partial [Micromonospora chalcea]